MKFEVFGISPKQQKEGTLILTITNYRNDLKLKLRRNPDYVFTITNALKQILFENGVQESKVRVLPNAVDASKFTAVDKDRQLERELEFQNSVVIGYIGSFVDYEGLDLLLEACAILKENHGNVFKLLLVGDGEVMQQLRRTVQFLQLGRSCRLHGSCLT